MTLALRALHDRERQLRRNYDCGGRRFTLFLFSRASKRVARSRLQRHPGSFFLLFRILDQCCQGDAT